MTQLVTAENQSHTYIKKRAVVHIGYFSFFFKFINIYFIKKNLSFDSGLRHPFTTNSTDEIKS